MRGNILLRGQRSPGSEADAILGSQACRGVGGLLGVGDASDGKGLALPTRDLGLTLQPTHTHVIPALGKRRQEDPRGSLVSPPYLKDVRVVVSRRCPVNDSRDCPPASVYPYKVRAGGSSVLGASEAGSGPSQRRCPNRTVNQKNLSQGPSGMASEQTRGERPGHPLRWQCGLPD